MLAKVVSKIAISDLVVITAASSVLYGLSMLHPAAPWIGAGLMLGFVSVELGKREAAHSRQE